MKEKLLFFVEWRKTGLFDINPFIQAFRRRYPQFRTVQEVDNIDYKSQCVKLILIDVVKIPTSKQNEYQVMFTNSSGKLYDTYYHRIK